MTSLPNLALLAPRTATAPAQTAGAESTNEGGAFAAALDSAREPTGEAGAPETCTADMADTPDTPGMPDRSERDDAADTPGAELGALLPGWPLAAWPGTAPAGAAARPTTAAALAADHAAPPLEALAPAQGLEVAVAGRLQRRAGHEHEQVRVRDAVPGPDPATPPVARTLTPRDHPVASVPTPADHPVAASPAAAPTSATAQAAEATAAPATAKFDLSVIAAPHALSAAWSIPGAAPGASASGVANAAVLAPPPFEARLAAAIDSAAFAPALANQVTWLAGEGVQHARIHLNPAEMGPLSVKIVLEGTHARIDFSADLSATRNAIEASLPSLAAALNDQGLTLAGGGVSDGRGRHGAARERDAPAAGSRNGGAAAVPALGTAVGALPRRPARGLIDLVA